MENIKGKIVTFNGCKYEVIRQSFSSYDGTFLDIRKVGATAGWITVTPRDIGYTERLANPERAYAWI